MKTAEELPPECVADLHRRKWLIERANARISQLQSCNADFTARDKWTYVEIEHRRPSFKGRDYVARSFEIIQ